MAGDVSRLRQMRNGIPPHTNVELGSGSNAFMVGVVLLSADQMLEINEATEEEYHDKEKDSKNNRARFYNILLCRYCMRDPDDLTQFMSDSVEEIGELLDDEDIKRVCEAYNNLIVNKAQKLEVLKQEDLDELKKFLEVTPLSDLNTVSLIHLKYFHQTMRM